MSHKYCSSLESQIDFYLCRSALMAMYEDSAADIMKHEDTLCTDTSNFEIRIKESEKKQSHKFLALDSFPLRHCSQHGLQFKSRFPYTSVCNTRLEQNIPQFSSWSFSLFEMYQLSDLDISLAFSDMHFCVHSTSGVLVCSFRTHESSHDRSLIIQDIYIYLYSFLLTYFYMIEMEEHRSRSRSTRTAV